MLRRGNHASAKFWRRRVVAGDRALSGSRHPQVFSGRFRVCRCRSCCACWRRKASATRSGSRPTPCWSGRSPTCSSGRWVGRRTSREVFYASFRYRAGSWDQARRVVAKVEWHAGELFPRVGFIVTNLKAADEARGPLLQPNGHGGTVDQGGQERRQVDEAVVPAVQGQRDAAAVVRPGLQPGQLPSATGAAQADHRLDADDAAGEVDQDRGQDRRHDNRSLSSWRRWRCPACCSSRY